MANTLSTNKALITQKTIDEFHQKPLTLGSIDCAHLVAKHLVNCGYQDYMAGKSYTDLKSAKSVIQSLGFATLSQYLDSVLEAIPHSYAMCGDIVALNTHSSDAVWERAGIAALGIRLTQNRVLCFGEAAGQGLCGVMSALNVIGAWRVKVVA